MILVCFILDTTILPIVYGGVYTVPLTVVAVFLIGMLMGRMRGLLYITSGTLGLMTFFFMASGFLIGLILYNPGEHLRTGRKLARRRHLERATWVFALYAVGETALFMIQYFNTADLRIIYFVNIALRALICTGLVMLLRPVAYALLIGNNQGRVPTRNREVKSF